MLERVAKEIRKIGRSPHCVLNSMFIPVQVINAGPNGLGNGYPASDLINKAHADPKKFNRTIYTVRFFHCHKISH